MNLGLDLHGVLDTYPRTFKSIINLFEKTNDKIVIVSGPPRSKIE